MPSPKVVHGGEKEVQERQERRSEGNTNDNDDNNNDNETGLCLASAVVVWRFRGRA
jgi:hypothetical protein